ncbi:MAG: glycosyl hydrolase family 95 catalytic domain-containing protein [Mycobacteriales bacterium]
MELSRRTLLGGALAGAAASPLLGQLPALADDPWCGGDGLLDDRMAGDRAWERFLATLDPRWSRLPAAWTEGPFLGNGLLGSGVYAEPGANAVHFGVQHSQVQDHRPEFGSLFGLARLPIGHLTLNPVGAITGVDWRLDLWNAELRGTVTTAAGSLALRAFVHDIRAVLVVEVTPTDGEAGYGWTFHPEPAISPRVASKPPPAGYTGNADPTVSQHGDTHLVDQPLLAGGGHATAYREVRRGRTRTLYLHVAWSFPGSGYAEAAVRAVAAAAVLPAPALAATHQPWWHGYYRKSFTSLPDARLQGFYWIQLYKVAAATRREAPVMTTCGPWLEPTPWPAVWWNLNVQLEYWLIHGSNHLELDALTRTLDQYRDNLVAAVPAQYQSDSAGMPRTTDMTALNSNGTGTSGYPVGVPGQDTPTPEVGNLTWALHNVWLSYRHTMDVRILRDVVYPLLRRSVNYYLHFLSPGADGRLHLPLTFSPEYGTAPDCNYDLALLRWGCRTLLDATAQLGIADPLRARWQDVLANLVDYPVGPDGFLIGAGVPLDHSHRHYSHMLSVYPLYDVTYEQPDKVDLIDRSLNHWISFEGALQGYSFTGAASISAQARRGDAAAFYLNQLLDRFIQPNTMYHESGPVIETPLSAAQSVHDMLYQSWGGVIRVFPAVPAAWPDVTVHNVRTQGAFLLSAARSGGATRWVGVRSLAGAPCRVRPGFAGPYTVRGGSGRRVPWRVLPGGDLALDLRRGEEAVVYPAGSRPDLTVAPVPIALPSPPWGLP